MTAPPEKKPPLPGSKWRLGSEEGDTTFAVANRGIFDELVVDDWLHIEQMSERVWWMRVGDARIFVELDDEGSPVLSVERDCY
ncbi:MAG: hypothetical protein AB8H86_04775 [Polyangiales bacterium]